MGKMTVIDYNTKRDQLYKRWNHYYRQWPHATFQDGVVSCFYCGQCAHAFDHHPPLSRMDESWIGRAFLLPACNPCNTSLGDFPSDNVMHRVARMLKLLEGQRHRDAHRDMVNWYDPNERELNATLRQDVEEIKWGQSPHTDIRWFPTNPLAEEYIAKVRDLLDRDTRSEIHPYRLWAVEGVVWVENAHPRAVGA